MTTGEHDQMRERVALYLLGALSEQEARAFEDHLSGGCTVCAGELDSFRRVSADLALAAAPAAPPQALRERVLASIRAARPSGPEPPAEEAQLVRSHEGEWQALEVPGVRVKQLAVDRARGRVTLLVRMDPGATYPPHRHAGPEECYVLEGDLHFGDRLVMRAGDYQRAEPETLHETSWTQGGCLLLIGASQHDQVLPQG